MWFTHISSLVTAMLPSSELTSHFQNAIQQIIDRTENQKNISKIDITTSGCSFEWSEKATPMEINIRKVARNLLHHFYPLCSHDIPEETLIAHIQMLAPGFPLDLISLFQDAISGTITEPETVPERI